MAHARPVLLVIHDLREATALANRVAVIEAGRLVQVGAIAELEARPASKFVEALLADTTGGNRTCSSSSHPHT